MRSWLLAAVAFVALTACTDAVTLDSDPAAQGETAGNTALFCRAWPEARRTVVNLFEGEDQRFQDTRSAATVDETMAAYNRSVPAEVRTEWSQLYDTYLRASDLAHTVGYAGHTVRNEHVTMMFGPGGMESAMTVVTSAIEAIDEWSVSGCGDFCSRWLELKEAVVLEPDHWLFQGHHEDEYRERMMEKEEAAIHAGTVLVPTGPAEAWEMAAALKSRFLDIGRQHGREAFQGEDGMERFAELMGMSDEAVYRESQAAVEEIEAWVAASCDPASLTGGAPGSLSVRIRPRDDLVGRTILLALLPVGTDFGSVTDASDYLGALCPEVYQPPELFDRELASASRDSGRTEDELLDEWLQSEPLRPMRDVGEYHEGSICSLVLHDWDGQGQSALVLPGGAYELFAGTFVGDPGSYDLYFAAPERCAQVTVNVDGDTAVDLPELDDCDLKPIGTAEEIARRPSSPPTGDSHLWLELPGIIQREGSPRDVTAVLVPSGTTLGEIGRGNTWPSGGVRMGYLHIEGGDDPWRLRRAGENGLVPILPYGMGGGVVNAQPQIDWDEPWDGFFPEPAGLDRGTYDLRIVGEWGEEGCDDDSCRRVYCGFVVVEVDGDTIVPLPEWGECP